MLGRGDRCGIGYVEHERPGVAADLLDCALAALNCAATDEDGDSSGRKLACSLFVDASAGARDESCGFGDRYRDAGKPSS